MSADSAPFRFVVLPGAGSGLVDLDAFVASPRDETRFISLLYPGWRRYIDENFSFDDLICEWANEFAKTGPLERIGILGVSLGGHLGFALALRLRTLGVAVAGLCVVDSLMLSSPAVRPGSGRRHFSRFAELAREGSVGAIFRLIRSLFWRALLRLAGRRTVPWLRRWRDNALFLFLLNFDPILEYELSMRLLIRAVAPWLAKLDSGYIPLQAPSAHLRTDVCAKYDAAWRVRCPNMEFIEIPVTHAALLDPKNFPHLRDGFALATHDWR